MSLVISNGQAEIPAPAVRKSVQRPPNPLITELTNVLRNLPADGKSFVTLRGKSAQGLVLVCGKVAARMGCGVRTVPQSDTDVRVWKVALTAEQIAAKQNAAAKRKEARIAKAAAAE